MLNPTLCYLFTSTLLFASFSYAKKPIQLTFVTENLPPFQMKKEQKKISNKLTINSKNYKAKQMIPKFILQKLQLSGEILKEFHKKLNIFPYLDILGPKHLICHNSNMQQLSGFVEGLLEEYE